MTLIGIALCGFLLVFLLGTRVGHTLLKFFALCVGVIAFILFLSGLAASNRQQQAQAQPEVRFDCPPGMPPGYTKLICKPPSSH